MSPAASETGRVVRTRRYLSVPAGTYPPPVRSGKADPEAWMPPPVAEAGPAPEPGPFPAPPPPVPFDDQEFLRDEFAAQIEEAMEREVLPAPEGREERRGGWGGVGWGIAAGAFLGLPASGLLLRLIQPDLLERPARAFAALSASELISAGLVFLAFVFLGAGAGSRWRARRASRN